jgi:hypothetical protein
MRRGLLGWVMYVRLFWALYAFSLLTVVGARLRTY